MTERLRLMAVHAHPDDESSKGAATMAKYARTGYEVLVVSCTGGERGDVLNPRLKGDPGQKLTFDQVMLVSDGDKITIGKPFVKGASLIAEVVEHFRGL